jgi:hypothetical protein
MVNQVKDVIIINKRYVVPLPQWRGCPLTCPQALFSRRTIVLALYPQTSCFYKGIVESTPRVGKNSYTYISWVTYGSHHPFRTPCIFHYEHPVFFSSGRSS